MGSQNAGWQGNPPGCMGAVLMAEPYDETLGHGFIALLLYMGSVFLMLFILKAEAVLVGVL